MGYYFCGGLYYDFLIYWNGKQAVPAFADSQKVPISYLLQSEREGEGHNCIHLKGHLFKVPSRVTFPLSGVVFNLQPATGQGTPSYVASRMVGTIGSRTYYVLVGSADNVCLSSYGSIETQHQSGFTWELSRKPWPGMVDGIWEKLELSDFRISSDAKSLSWNRHQSIKRWDGHIDEYDSRGTGPLVISEDDFESTDDAEGLVNIVGGRLLNLLDDLREGYEPHFHGNYSYVCADACEKIRYDHHNTILNTMELLNFNKSVGDMYSSYKELLLPASPSKRLKRMASSYLGTKYGPRLTLLELGDIINAEHSFNKRGSTTATRKVRWSSHLFDFEGEDRVSFDYQFGVYNEVMATLGSWGLSPITLSDVWDAVPYSFVVDWFVNVSDLLENPERRGFMDSLPVSNIWVSEKSRSKGSISNLQTKAYVSYDIQLYVRDAKSELGTQLSGYTTSSSISAQDHIPEMGAVLVNLLT